MLIWSFSLDLVCGTRAEVCSHLSVTLYYIRDRDGPLIAIKRYLCMDLYAVKTF
jgi:hypothetical protein